MEIRLLSWQGRKEPRLDCLWTLVQSKQGRQDGPYRERVEIKLDDTIKRLASNC